MTPFRPARCQLEELFDARIQALTSPHRYFRAAAHRFLFYLQTDFPQVRQLSELRRDPHLLGWLRRSPDGNRFLLIKQTPIDGADPGSIHVVINWTAGPK